jgi:2-oxoglutarate dehydrogenase E1 component
MGESVTEGTVVEWRVKPGQWIDQGETLVDVTTDKVDVEVPAPAAGVVRSVLAEAGVTVAVGAALAEIDTAAAKPAGAVESPAPATPVPAKPAQAPAAEKTAGEKPAPPNGAPGVPVVPGVSGTASQRARRLAERAHLDLGAINGSGPDGLILRDDVERAGTGNGAVVPAKPSVPATPQPPLAAGANLVPLKGPAASLVGYMEASLAIPTATSFRTLQVATLEARRGELNAALAAAGRKDKISFTHLIAFAIVRAARELPAMTFSFRREGAQPYRVEGGIGLGLAVDAQRKDGTRFLTVPVIKDAAELEFAEFRRRYEELVAKARDNKLTADDLTGASLTLTNPGGIGTVASVPRLMPGQGTIVAAGAIGYPPGLQSANPAALEQLGVEKTMTLTSTYDHRVIQGAQSGEFLGRIDALLRGADGFYDAIFASLGVAPGRPRAEAPKRATQTAAPVAVTEQAATPPREIEPYSDELLRAVAAGMAIVSAYRRHGHLAATLDPLGAQPQGDPALDVHNYGLTPSIMSAIPASILRTKLAGSTLADVVGELRRTYSATIAYEIEHIANIEQREWLRDYIESGRHFSPLPAERARNILGRLTKVETFERYLRKSYIGQKTFSIEGLDAMIPMLEEVVTEFAADGVKTAVIGMAHRGRLSTIAHVVNRPYEELLVEFEAANARGEGAEEQNATGDVKYHHGADGTYHTIDKREIAVALASNPSHLEAVDGVVEGRTRALQTDHNTPQATLEVGRAAPILVHGDAAFSAQGIVAEVLNLQGLAGYSTGGTIHLIANNQIGFTTDPRDARSTRYASDLAKGFDVPIVHVNADDVEACMAAVHLAVDFRRRFGHDAIIDLIGYRRFGHNETDEPAYTQPEMYERIKTHPTVRELYAQKLIAQGIVTSEDVNALLAQASRRIDEAQKNLKSGTWREETVTSLQSGSGKIASVDTAVAREKLLAWNDELVAVPANFTPHPKLVRQIERRKAAFANEGEADWGLAEALAFASLLAEGTPIRLTGQDTQRGTFSHRHLVLHDPKTGQTYAPIGHLSDALASFEVYNSPLSEYACLGFEYGYSIALPNALVLWEAQFGDFMNGAQIIIDQFISAGQAKWNETSRLVLLLPHGYEGAGPEHSSARIERFLQLSAEGSVVVANCSTAAQYFHLLRLQARSPNAAPLVIFTPKSLLRLGAASARIDELSTGRFRPVIDDPRAGLDRAKVERILLCSGKIYYDLTSEPAFEKMTKTAVVRVELLSPLPVDEILALLASYPKLKRVVWVQEEPKNMGARAHVRRRLVERLPKNVADIEYIGRSYRASPSEGYGGAHAVEQERILKEALTE